ncbi:SDR family oxidoreductase [Oceanobacillus piezotolerans]|uniref:SDR family oxidoreductase n=1 Tax=Oceanobacillus piezotolerans TaxID=2448030 RepID=A0A498D8I6_9BACI|nr:SDR family NAD(P)-dependent oxidoreductase [Oceanobacillus piezotolerans]RLL46856.1 SDR family oxidoreductase [Oceanobacillus piezotolerans]
MKDKSVIITGGGSGIGKTTAIRLAKEGARVMVTDINVDSAHETTKIIKENNGISEALEVDVTKVEDIKMMIKKTVDVFGNLDTLINNAGISNPETLLHKTDEETWNKVIDVCLNGVYLGMKYAIPELIKNGGGTIINTSSIAGIKGQKFLSAYSAAKSGVIAITKTTALEYGKYGIRVNAIAPSIIDTPIVDGWKESHKWEILSTANALRRIGQPEEVAETILFLASDKSSFITGRTLAIDGGTLLGR